MIHSNKIGEVCLDVKQEPDVYYKKIDSVSNRMTSDTSEKMLVRYSSLVALCLQNAGLVLLTTYVRQRKGDAFSSTTAVMVTEAVKVLACLVIITANTRSIKETLKHLNVNIIQQPKDCIMVSIPSFIYVIQNNLLYVALTNLDAATFQVVYQLKILTTAVFSVIMLGKKLSRMQWFSLFMLFVGISIVQLQRTQSSSKSENSDRHPYIGILAVLISCTMSGFAGVYFEKILKGTKSTIWIRNIQLGMLGMVIGYATMWLTDGSNVYTNGFFFGYDWLVWCVIFLQSFGGLMVAVVIKYTDNILKGFATSMAILISCIGSYYIFDFTLTIQFGVGTSVVMASVFMYNKFVFKPPANIALPA